MSKVNEGFDPEADDGATKNGVEKKVSTANPPAYEETGKTDRPQWNNQLEFLMSCIATSVGLGNVWRFPFIAYQNGGGAFLIPYIIVLFLVGKPMYYIECILGQFSSRNSIRVWAMSPAMKGVGYAQTLGCGYVLSYYVSIIALCLYYLVMSFQSTLPWSVCDLAWEEPCIPSGLTENIVHIENASSSAELYFLKTVLQQKPGIEGGLGAPIWYLTLALFISWLIIFFIVVQGVKSSGKAAYFLAIFPYIVMITLLISTCTLSGAGQGILFFITPQWDKLLLLEVWYAAVTQVFFSLSVNTGAIIMFSSFNNFRHSIYRDAMIVTYLDTVTSLLSGITIFGILGNLAYILEDEVSNVVGSGGTGLAFISYPDAIAKTPMPQLFSVLFFVMMSVLGVGSGVALLSTINTVLLDAFPKVKVAYLSAICCTGGFCIGLIYVTPAGQFMVELVDYYGGTFLILFCAITEIVGVFWIYGVENICLDIEFMVGIKTSMYWRLCWGLITPAMMLVVFGYALVSFEALVVGEYVFPTAGYAAGYCMLFLGILFVPICIVLSLIKYWNGNFKETVREAFRPKDTWGPRNAATREEWKAFRKDIHETRKELNHSKFKHIAYSLTNMYKT